MQTIIVNDPSPRSSMHTCIFAYMHTYSTPPPLPAGSGGGMRYKRVRGGLVVGAVLSTFYVLIGVVQPNQRTARRVARPVLGQFCGRCHRRRLREVAGHSRPGGGGSAESPDESAGHLVAEFLGGRCEMKSLTATGWSPL